MARCKQDRRDDEGLSEYLNFYLAKQHGSLQSSTVSHTGTGARS